MPSMSVDSVVASSPPSLTFATDNSRDQTSDGLLISLMCPKTPSASYQRSEYTVFGE